MRCTRTEQRPSPRRRKPGLRPAFDLGCFYLQSIVPKIMLANCFLAELIVLAFLPSASATIRNASVSMDSSSALSTSFFKRSGGVAPRYKPPSSVWRPCYPIRLSVLGNSASSSRFLWQCPASRLGCSCPTCEHHCPWIGIEEQNRLPSGQPTGCPEPG